MWYVWECDKCTSTMQINYDATEADYLRFRKCGCKAGGEYVWKENHNDPNGVIWYEYS